MPPLRAPWLYATLAVALAFSWQCLTVRANAQGDLTALFRVGATTLLPPSMSPGPHRSRHANGYDGQYYLMLAHDPLLRHGTYNYLDSPVRRARRILLPWLASALALGQPRFVHLTLIFWILASLFTGVFFLATLSLHRGRHPALGLLFLAVPASLIAIDTITIDISLAALTALLLWLAITQRLSAQWSVLAAAALVRETGLLLAVAWTLDALLQRNLRRAALWASSALPFLAWAIYVQRTAPVSGASHDLVPWWILPDLSVGVLNRALHPPAYLNLTPAVARLVQSLDVLSLLATAALAACAVFLFRSELPRPHRLALALFAAFVLSVSNLDFWTTPYGYGRAFAPLFPLLLATPRRPSWPWLLAALAFIDLRILAEWKTQIDGVISWAIL